MTWKILLFGILFLPAAWSAFDQRADLRNKRYLVSNSSHLKRAKRQEASSSEFECLGRSFLVKISQLEIHDTIILIDYSLSATLMPDNVYLEAYVSQCLREIVVVTVIEEPFYERFTFNTLEINGFLVIRNLPPLSQFRLLIGYTQTAPSPIEYLTDERLGATCFLPPSPVVGLKSVMLKSGEVLLSWTEPTEVNSPRICFYEISATADNGQLYFKYKSTDTEIVIGKVFLKRRLTLTVVAVNSASCYQSQYPFVRNCTYLQRQSSAVKLVLNPNDFKSTRPPTSMVVTTKPGNGGTTLSRSTTCFCMILAFSGIYRL